MFLDTMSSKLNMLFVALTLSQTRSFSLFQAEEFADDNFKFDENSGKFIKRVGNTVGKGEIARNKQFLLFPLFLAPLAIGQRAYVMARCLSCVRPSVRLCVNFFFKHLLR